MNESITHINLRSNNIGDAGAQALADVLKVNRSITHTDLFDNQIGEVGAEASPRCQAPCPDRGRLAPFAPGTGRGGAGERRHPRDQP
ncbi:unnamed protein product [Durusdinium trenchii]|uniref:Uncharacterized protein n=1 Tax=Durusdinium trenchii TaxID=1381693 RepID=A0ABP0KML6_9DINO